MLRSAFHKIASFLGFKPSDDTGDQLADSDPWLEAMCERVRNEQFHTAPNSSERQHDRG